jgi:glutathione S-transferase
MGMYELYGAPGSASLAVHWMLLELGVPFEFRRLDLDAGEQRSAEYLKLNPAGRVPTLVVDGKPYAECTALLMLLAERHPDAGLDPARDAPERALYLQTMLYLANTLMPPFRAWFYPDEGLPREVSQPRIEAVWDRMDAQLADGRAFILGERMSAADFLLTMLTRWSRNMPKPAQQWPHLGRYMARMKQRPALVEVHKREGLTDWIS